MSFPNIVAVVSVSWWFGIKVAGSGLVTALVHAQGTQYTQRLTWMPLTVKDAITVDNRVKKAKYISIGHDAFWVTGQGHLDGIEPNRI